jgi:hypothetical protein
MKLSNLNLEKGNYRGVIMIQGMRKKAKFFRCLEGTIIIMISLLGLLGYLEKVGVSRDFINAFWVSFIAGSLLLLSSSRSYIGIVENIFVYRRDLLTCRIPLNEIKTIDIYMGGKYLTIRKKGGIKIVEYLFDGYDEFIEELRSRNVCLIYH